MANWHCVARSNHFKVKDDAVFRARMEKIGLNVLDGEGDLSGTVMIAPSDLCYDGSFPRTVYDETTDEHTDIDIASEVAKHLQKGQVAVFMEAGAEKPLYMSGYAEAIDSTGKRVAIDLNDIYGKAKEAFGVEPTRTEC